ncbi:MAG: flavin reductase [Bacteroidota bacterium]
MHLNKEDILGLERVKRLNIINSVTGIKPANLIGTISNSGVTNVAIFSSIVHLGSNPALIGFIIRPNEEVPRHTYQNIQENEVYTINHVHPSIAKRAHYTSAKFDYDISEFEACHLTEEFIDDFKAPFVKESELKLGMRFRESIPIKANGTIIVIGEIEEIIIPDAALDNKGYIDLSKTNSMGISGLNSYYTVEKREEFPYARVNEIPDFSTSAE